MFLVVIVHLIDTLYIVYNTCMYQTTNENYHCQINTKPSIPLVDKVKPSRLRSDTTESVFHVFAYLCILLVSLMFAYLFSYCRFQFSRGFYFRETTKFRENKLLVKLQNYFVVY